jgi:hypothetical protein
VGVSRDLAATGQFPTVLGRDVGRRRVSVGLLLMSALTIVLVVLFNLDSIASLGSAVALIVFSMVTLGHFRLRRATGARLWLLVVGFASTVVTADRLLHDDARRRAGHRGDTPRAAGAGDRHRRGLGAGAEREAGRPDGRGLNDARGDAGGPGRRRRSLVAVRVPAIRGRVMLRIPRAGLPARGRARRCPS